MHNFVCFSLYIISLIKIINKYFSNFFFLIILYLFIKRVICTQAVKCFLILAYYCYLHMHKLQLEKKKKCGVQERFYEKTVDEHI